MKKKPGKDPEKRPVLIEAPKPVNQMSKKDLDGFVDEILEAIDGQTPTTSCPQCSSKSGLREIFYGLPDGPVDEKKYAIGGCCISDNDPTVKKAVCQTLVMVFKKIIIFRLQKLILNFYFQK